MAEQEIVRLITVKSGDSEKSVKGLRDEIKNLRDELLNVEKGSEEYEKITNKIVQDQKQLNDVMNAGSKAIKGESVELKELKVALQNLEPGTLAYNQAFTRAATITHNLAEQQTLLKYSSRDLGTQLGNIRGIATNMVAGFSAINAAMGLFGKENEDVQKAMLKTQQLIAVVQGLQGLEGMTNRLKGLTNALTLNTKATKAATTAQKGLNVAMKANPIGLLLTALAALIVYWKDIWGWLTKLVGGTERMNELMDEAKAKIMGVANAIGQYLIMPVKTAITYFTTLGTVIKDIFTGNWSKIREDVRKGIDGIKEDVKNGFSVMKNYEEGYNKQVTRNTKKRYEEQKRLLEENTKKSREQYDKDMDNYIKDEEAKKGHTWKFTEEGKKAYEAFYKNKMEMYAKDTEEFRRAQRDMWSYQREYQERMKENNGGGSGGRGKTKEQMAKEEAEAAKAREDAYKRVLDYIGTIEHETKKLHDNELEMINDLAEYYGNIIAKSDDANLIEELTNTFLKEVAALRKVVSENVSKLYVDEMYDAVAAIEKAGEVAVNSLNSEYNLKELLKGLFVPDDIISHINEVYETEVDTINKSLEVVERQIDALNDLGLQGTETHKKLIDTRLELLTREQNLEIQYIKDISDAEKQGYDLRLQNLDKYYEERKRKIEIETKQENNEGSFLGSNKWSAQREMAAADKEFEAAQKRLEDLKVLYAEMAADENLAFEEREQANIKFYDTMIELDDLRLQHEIENNAKRQALIKEQISYYSSVNESIGRILGSVADAWEESINEQVKQGKISEEEGKRQFERVKALQITQSIINTISGGISAFMSAMNSGIPYPWNIAAGAVSSAAVVAAGMAEVAKIRNTTLSSSNTSVATSAAIVSNPTSDYRPQYTQTITNQNEIDTLSNAVSNGVARSNMQVSVVEINDVQNRVAVREREASF